MVIQEIVPYLQPFVRAVFRRSHDGMVEFWGSGFVVEEQSRYFFVTATHVMDAFSEETPLYFDKGVDTSLCPIQGLEYSIPPKEISERKITDAAIIELDERSKTNISCNCSIELSNLDVGNIYDVSSGCLAIGYPEKMNKGCVDHLQKEISPKLYTLYTIEADPDKYERLGVNANDYIVLHWEKKKAYSPERQKRTAPDLNGLSGTPIWGICEGGPKIIAMLTEYHAHDIKAILGVRASVISESIRALTRRLC